MAYVNSTPQLGIADVTGFDPLAPGPVNLVGTNASGRFPQLGTVVQAWDPTYGGGEFMFVSFPVSTAVSAGTIMVIDGAYSATAMPTSSANTGRTVGVCITAVTSSSSVQYGWIQISGKATVLKTAVTVPAASRLFISGTAGRFYVTASAGKQILGMRTANTSSVTSTTSTVLVQFNKPVIEGA